MDLVSAISLVNLMFTNFRNEASVFELCYIGLKFFLVPKVE